MFAPEASFARRRRAPRSFAALFARADQFPGSRRPFHVPLVSLCRDHRNVDQVLQGPQGLMCPAMDGEDQRMVVRRRCGDAVDPSADGMDASRISRGAVGDIRNPSGQCGALCTSTSTSRFGHLNVCCS